MVGWHHRLSGHEFEQTLGDSEGQGNLACCSPWGYQGLHATEQLNNNNLKTVTLLLLLFSFFFSCFHSKIYERVSP